MIFRIVCLFIFLWTQSAYALDFTEFLGVNIGAPNFSSTTDPTLRSSPDIGLGGGITLGFKFFPIFDLEVGLIYSTTTFNVFSANAPQTSYSLAETEIPFVVRYWFTDSFSAGIGPYFSIKSGNIGAKVGSEQKTFGYDDLSWANTDLGWTASIRYRRHINELITFIVDQRFLFGIRNRDSSGQGNFMTRDLQTWAGIAFDL